MESREACSKQSPRTVFELQAVLYSSGTVLTVLNPTKYSDGLTRFAANGLEIFIMTMKLPVVAYGISGADEESAR